MISRIITIIALCLAALAASAQTSRTDSILAHLADKDSRYVLVVAHRGDWRNYPENSLAAMESAIRQGADMIELDIALTADSQLVLCHDRTIDRTTTGRGLISDLTLDSLRRVRLKTGHDIATNHRMPTFREALEVCKDRILVNIDKGWEYYDLALPIAEELGVTSQMLLKGKKPLKEIDEKFAPFKSNMPYMPIIDIQRPAGQVLFKEYMDAGVVPPAYEVCWSQQTPEVEECFRRILGSGSKLWVNSLWDSLNGGLSDDKAFEGSPEEIYGRLVGMGATIIQTDRVPLLIEYLRSKGLHN